MRSALKASWLALAGALLLAAPELVPAEQRLGFNVSSFFLNLDGLPAGFLHSTNGGSATAEVIEEAPGPSFFTKKHIGQVKYEDISLQVGFSLSKAVHDWIAASWGMNYQRKNGSIVILDYKLEAVSERQFFQALITEVGIPACDGSSREPGYLTLRLAPEYTRVVPGEGGKLDFPFMKQPATLWLPSNFRLTIDGLDTSKVSKIDAFAVKQKVVQDALGEMRDYSREPGKLEFPNLKVTLSTDSAQSWADWHEDFVIKGNNDESKERNGMLEFLSPNRGTVLARIRFYNVGIVSLGPAKAAADPCNSGCPADPAAVQDAIGRAQAELYVERMEFETGDVTR